MGKYRSLGAALGAGLITAAAGVAIAQQAAEPHSQADPLQNVSDMKFMNVANVPTCAQASIQTGDPASTSFIAMVKAKAGCTIPWHWHSAAEHLMIVTGSVRITMADKDKPGGKPEVLRAGGWANLPAKHLHDFRCNQACTFYLYSDGKFDINYVDREGEQISPEEALKPFRETPATAMK